MFRCWQKKAENNIKLKFDKLKEFLTGLKEAFKQVGINPDEIDWSPTNVMNYKGSYVLVDV